MGQAEQAGFQVEFSNRTLRAERPRMDVLNAKKKGARRRAYRDRIRVTEPLLGFATAAIDALPLNDPIAGAFAAELGHFIDLGRRVVDQTRRRVLEGEKVPANNKRQRQGRLHLRAAHRHHHQGPIIIKDRRDVLYGHKLGLTAGASSLVIDLVIEDGHPADATLVERTVDRVIDIYGKPPRLFPEARLRPRTLYRPWRAELSKLRLGLCCGLQPAHPGEESSGVSGTPGLSHRRPSCRTAGPMTEEVCADAGPVVPNLALARPPSPSPALFCSPGLPGLGRSAFSEWERMC